MTENASSYKRAREAAGLSAMDASSHLGITVWTLYSYEKEQTNPNAALIKKMTQLYHCSSDELLGLIVS